MIFFVIPFFKSKFDSVKNLIFNFMSVKSALNNAINSLNDTDLNLWLIEPIKKTYSKKNKKSFLDKEDQKILELLSGKENRTVLVLNKIDKIKKEQILFSISKYSDLANFAAIVPVSALKSTNVENLVDVIKKYLPAI